jgi:hypothetical protein
MIFQGSNEREGLSEDEFDMDSMNREQPYDHDPNTDENWSLS